MTVIYNMSIDRADKPSIGRRRFTEAVITISHMAGGRVVMKVTASWPALHERVLC